MTPLPPAPLPEHDRILLIGDIVGKPGTQLVCQAIPRLKEQLQLAAVVANAENSADGSGLTSKDFQKLIQAGIDVVTMGDHIYRKREILDVLEKRNNIVRPANYPSEAIGNRWALVTLPSGNRLYVISLIGRVFMKPVDCPFHAADQVLKELATYENQTHNRDHLNTNSPLPALVLVDFHAEATSDKQSLGRFLDGRVTAVLGTHTHVTTADEQILPKGTAFQCDVGMSGSFESILGRKIESVLEATLTMRPVSFSVATEDVRISCTWIDACRRTGLAQKIGRLTFCEKDLGN